MSIEFAPMVIAVATALVSAVTDLKSGYVFDRILAPAAGLLVLLSAIAGDALSAASGAVVGAAVPAALHFASRGRGIGLGDVKLAALLGAATGASGALGMIAISFISGGVVAVALLIAGRSRTDTVPFAPFLCVGICAIAFAKAVR